MVTITKNEVMYSGLCCKHYVYDYNITDLLYVKLQNDTTKIAKKCFDILDSDLCSVYIYRNKAIFDAHSSYDKIPNYFYDYIRKIVRKIAWL